MEQEETKEAVKPSTGMIGKIPIKLQGDKLQALRIESIALDAEIEECNTKLEETPRVQKEG